MYRFSIGLCIIGYYGLSFLIHPKKTIREAMQKEADKYDVAMHITLGLWCFFTMLCVIFIIFNEILGPLNFFEGILLGYGLHFYLPYSVLTLVATCVIFHKAGKYLDAKWEKKREEQEMERYKWEEEMKERERQLKSLDRALRKMP